MRNQTDEIYYTEIQGVPAHIYIYIKTILHLLLYRLDVENVRENDKVGRQMWLSQRG